MSALPELVPISELRLRQTAVLGHLAAGPVILTQHGRAAAVMLTPDTYNRMVSELETLQSAIVALTPRSTAQERPGARDQVLARSEPLQVAEEQPYLQDGDPVFDLIGLGEGRYPERL